LPAEGVLCVKDKRAEPRFQLVSNSYGEYKVWMI